MAKMTIDSVTYEGTPEELREIVRTFEVAEVAEDTESVPEFTDGDCVKITGESLYGTNKDGEIGVFDGIDSDGDHLVLFGAEQLLFKAYQLEKVAEGDMLKVGDTVEVIDGSKSEWGDLSTGTIGEITRNSGSGYAPYRVETEDNFDRFPAEALRKVTEEVPKFGKGDIVKGVRMLGGEVIYGEVYDSPDDDGNYGVASFVDGKYRAIIGKTLELVARAEDRVDTK